MKKQIKISLVLVFVMLATAALALARQDGDNEAQLLTKAKLSLPQAIERALAEVHGSALSAELKDGDQLAFVVEVVKQKQTYEVTVDALNGKILGKALDQKDRDEDDDRADRD